MIKSNTFEFIKKAKLIHGDGYDYSLVDYVNNKLKVKIICRIHGKFEQIAQSHLNGKGCLKCSGTYQYDTREFIEKAKLKHGNKYDYSLVEYVNCKSKIKIICEKHGEFKQTPHNHLHGYGCIKCSGKYLYNTNEFIEKAKLKHGDKYDYSNVNYYGGNNTVNIGCLLHGFFKIKASVHLTGSGCPRCSAKPILTTDEFIEKAKLIHGDKYDYSLVDYKFRKIKINIVCKKHGEFKQTPHNHLHGAGCPKCNISKGEILIQNFLIKNNIEYINQKKFKDCKGKKNALKFDFYIPKHKYVIEFDGRQHFEVVMFNGCTYEKALKTHLELVSNDLIKNKYCIDNNITMHRIRYDMKNINEYLSKIFKI
jgi:hypothetical protein